MSWTNSSPIQFPGFEEVDYFSSEYSGESPQSMLVSNLLPEGAPGMLVGEPLTSKTQLALSLSIGVASGTPVLGQDVSAARPVIYIANEGSRRELATRVERIRVNAGVVGKEEEVCLADNLHILIPSIDPSTFEPVSPSTIYRVVRSMAQEDSQPGLLVIDTLAPLITGEENSAESARKIWSMAYGISNSFGWTVLFIHHKRKTYGKKGSSGAGNDLSEIRGTSAHGAAARYILSVMRIQAGHARNNATEWSPFPSTPDILELKMIKRNDGPVGFTLHLGRDCDTGLLREVSPPFESVRAHTQNDRGVCARTGVKTKEGEVLRIYQDPSIPEATKEVQALELFSKAGDPRAALRSALRRLRGKGKLP